MAAVCENPDKIVTDEPFFSRHSETIAPQIVRDYSRLLEIVDFIGIYRFGFFWVRICSWEKKRWKDFVWSFVSRIRSYVVDLRLRGLYLGWNKF